MLGSVDRGPLDDALVEAEARLGREISLVTMTVEEWDRRRTAGEAFVEELRRQPKIWLVGDERALP